MDFSAFASEGQLTFTHWIMTALQLASTIALGVSIWFARRSINTNSENLRKRNTIELIEKAESRPHYRDLNRAFGAVFRERDENAPSLSRLHNPQNDEDWDWRRKIQSYLNHYELIGLGVAQRTLDAPTYREWMATTLISDWNRAAEYIQRERWKQRPDGTWQYTDRLFEQFQRLAERWGHVLNKDVVVLSEDYSGPPETASGPGDVALAPGRRPARLRVLKRLAS